MFAAILNSFLVILVSFSTAAFAADEKDVVQKQINDINSSIKKVDEKMLQLNASINSAESQYVGFKNAENIVRSNLIDELFNYHKAITNLAKVESLPKNAMLIDDALNGNYQREPILKFSRQLINQNINDQQSSLDELIVSQKQQLAAKENQETLREKLEEQRLKLVSLRNEQRKLLSLPVEERKALFKQSKNLGSAESLNVLFEKIDRSFAKEYSEYSINGGYKTLPVSGEVISKYNQKDEAGVLAQGVTIVASAGSNVNAVKDGRVIYSGTFRGYGFLLILEHNDGYHSVYSGLSESRREVGDFAAAGTTIGFLPKTEKPILYFELRKDGTPVNPHSWLAQAE